MGMGPPYSSQGTSASPDIPPDLYLPLLNVGPACLVSPTLLPVLMWLLLYILSSRTEHWASFQVVLNDGCCVV